MNQYRGGYEGQGGGRGNYRDYGGGQREQSHANFGMRRDRRDSDRQNRPPYEELREATAGELVRESCYEMRTQSGDAYLSLRSLRLKIGVSKME